jgi:hypothetical protein
VAAACRARPPAADAAFSLIAQPLNHQRPPSVTAVCHCLLPRPSSRAQVAAFFDYKGVLIDLKVAL